LAAEGDRRVTGLLKKSHHRWDAQSAIATRRRSGLRADRCDVWRRSASTKRI